MNHAIPMMCGTLVAELCTLPICTTKTVLQLDNRLNTKTALQQIYRQRGLYGFWAASLPAMTSQIFTSTSKYTLYKYFETIIPKEELTPYTHRTLSAVAGGITTSLLSHPLEFVKVHWQDKRKISPVLYQNGIRALYRGYGYTLIKTSLGAACFFPINDTLRERWHNAIMASVVTAIFAVLVTHPLDLARIKKLVHQPSSGRSFRLLYRGLTLNMARTVPHFVISINLTQQLEHYFD